MTDKENGPANAKNASPKDSDNNKNIERLADLLAQNHVNVSLSDDVAKGHLNIYKTIFNEQTIRQKNYTPMRCIAIVGAGADYSACNQLKLGKDTADALFKGLTARNKTRRDLVEKELDRLQRVYRLDKDGFETKLFALNKYCAGELKEKLKKIYSGYYNPCLTYEVLAHMMKHRFLDAIINFNFSELLDQAIRDELKNDEYHKIVFDGDVDISSYDLDENNELRLPLYIKPHGTISHYSTLRFTEEAYDGLPTEITELLCKLTSAEWEKKRIAGAAGANDHKRRRKMKVVLIVLGFNMQSFEFNIILNENLPTNSEVYFINGKQSEKKPEIDYTHLGKKETLKKIMTRKGLQANLIKLDHDDFIQKLWDSIESKFKSFRPRSIKRHQLISNLFKCGILRTDKEIDNYLWQRTYIEFALSVGKYKGFVTKEQIENDRFGKYLHLAIKNGKGGPQNLKKFIENFPMAESGYGSSRTYRLPALQSKKDGTSSIENLTTGDEKQYEDFICEIIHSVVKIGLSEKIKKNKDCLIETFNYLLKSEDTEISSEYENVYGHIFTKPKVIKSQLEFSYKTLKYLKEDRDELHIIAETGEWLYKILESEKVDSARIKEKTIMLINADRAYEHEHNKPQHSIVSPTYLPWWLHNQHLTLFVKDKIVRHAFYFTRRHRSSLVNPVEINSRDDDEGVKALCEIFAAYLLKSKNAGIIHKNQIEEKMNALYHKNPN